MCIQSYYNHRREEEEIELDLLREIKDFGIDKWNERVSEMAGETAKVKTEDEQTSEDR